MVDINILLQSLINTMKKKNRGFWKRIRVVWESVKASLRMWEFKKYILNWHIIFLDIEVILIGCYRYLAIKCLCKTVFFFRPHILHQLKKEYLYGLRSLNGVWFQQFPPKYTWRSTEWVSCVLFYFTKLLYGVHH